MKKKERCYDVDNFVVWRHIIIVLLLLTASSGWAQKVVSNPLDNSSWRDVETGDWIISLFDDHAIYDSKVWQYDMKSDDKVVLVSGNEKLTIAISKEKDGKRLFTIGSKKYTLSAITPKSIADYPIADNTSFNTELKEGNAILSGWLRCPKEMIKNYMIVEAVGFNIASNDSQRCSVQTDSLGRFELAIPLVGTQEVILFANSSEDEFIDIGTFILTPGEKYFMLKDVQSSQTLFMGNDARLQNELQLQEDCPFVSDVGTIENPVSDDSVSVLAQKWIQNYDTFVAQSKDFFSQHPNLSKRFCDYIRVDRCCYVCWGILMMHNKTYSQLLPPDVMQWVEDHSALDTSLPVNLITTMSSVLRNKRDCYVKADPRMHVLWKMPSILPWLEEKGMLHLNDKEHRAISEIEKMYREVFTLYSTMKDHIELDDSVMAIQEKYKEEEKVIDAIHQSDDYHRAVEMLCGGDGLDIMYAIIDSACTDTLTSSIHQAQILNDYLYEEKEALPEELERYIALIKEPYFRNDIIKKNERFKRQVEVDEEAVNAVIHPSSDVEGLTDGKAIIDKIIEPYRGKIVYLDVWGTWCGPCLRELRNWHELKDELKDYDMVYLYLANKSPEESWKDIIGKYELTKSNCVHYNLPDSQQQAVEEYIGLEGYPTYRVFDKQGGYHYYDRHHDNLLKFIQKIEGLN